MFNKYRKYFFLAAFVVLLFSGAAMANNQYQTEFVVGYGEDDYDSGNNATSRSGGVGVYFNPVNYSSGPYAESGFLSRESHFSMFGSSIESEISDFEFEGRTQGVAFSFAFKSTPFIVGVAFESGELETNVAAYKAHDRSLRGRYYLDSNTAITLSFSKTDSRWRGIIAGQEEETGTGVAYKKLLDLDGGRFLSVGGSLYLEESDGYDEDWKQASLGGSYYFNSAFGFGAGISVRSGDDEDQDGNAYSLSATYFVTKMFAIAALYSQYDSDGDTDRDSYMVVLNIRN